MITMEQEPYPMMTIGNTESEYRAIKIEVAKLEREYWKLRIEMLKEERNSTNVNLGRV